MNVGVKCSLRAMACEQHDASECTAKLPASQKAALGEGPSTVLACTPGA